MDHVRRALCIAGLCLWTALAAAQNAALGIKAAYLYKFGGFVEWPEGAFAAPAAPLVIGVLGAEPLADELEQAVAGRKVQERPVAVRRLRPGESIEGVHVLFVGAGEDARLREITAAARGQAVLIVTESESATGRGSMINFVVAQNRVRFDVALPAAEAGRLRISARLLSVARRVINS